MIIFSFMNRIVLIGKIIVCFIDFSDISLIADLLHALDNFL